MLRWNKVPSAFYELEREVADDDGGRYRLFRLRRKKQWVCVFVRRDNAAMHAVMSNAQADRTAAATIAAGWHLGHRLGC